MKKLNLKTLVVVSLIFGLCATSFAAKSTQCNLPKGCEYLDSEFSTGGGDKVSYVMEVTCKMPNKSIVKYTHWKISAGSLFGIGRFTAPKKIVFKDGNKDELVCNY
jgi:hypothetical protein